MSQFKSPRKCILSQEQLTSFQSSKIHQEVVNYIETLNDAVVGVKLTDECTESPVRFVRASDYQVNLICLQGVKAILSILEEVEKVANKTPPVENSASRFGNPAFRTFYDKVSEVRSIAVISNSETLFTPLEQLAPSLHETLPNLPRDAIPEVSVYFKEAWGNRLRIDYGSGMELNFLCWLYV